jgi:hypothetical protein
MSILEIKEYLKAKRAEKRAQKQREIEIKFRKKVKEDEAKMQQNLAKKRRKYEAKLQLEQDKIARRNAKKEERQRLKVQKVNEKLRKIKERQRAKAEKKERKFEEKLAKKAKRQKAKEEKYEAKLQREKDKIAEKQRKKEETFQNVPSGRYTSPKKNRKLFERIANYEKVYDKGNFEYATIIDNLKRGRNNTESDLEDELEYNWKEVQNCEDVFDDKSINGLMTSIRLGLCALGIAGAVAGGKAIDSEFNNYNNVIESQKASSEEIKNDLWREENSTKFTNKAREAFIKNQDNELLISFYLQDNNIPTDENGKVTLEQKVVIAENELQEYWSNIPEDIRLYIREPSKVIDCKGSYTDRDDILITYNERENTRDER